MILGHRDDDSPVAKGSFSILVDVAKRIFRHSTGGLSTRGSTHPPVSTRGTSTDPLVDFFISLVRFYKKQKKKEKKPGEPCFFYFGHENIL